MAGSDDHRYNDHIDYGALRLGNAEPVSLERSVLLTLAGAALAVVGFPLLAFDGGVYIFSLVMLFAGMAAFFCGFLGGCYLIIAGYVHDFRAHWQPRYKKAAFWGALVGLFFSLLYYPAAPVLIVAGAAVAVHLVRKAGGDTAFPSFPPTDSDTRQS